MPKTSGCRNVPPSAQPRDLCGLNLTVLCLFTTPPSYDAQGPVQVFVSGLILSELKADFESRE